MFIDTLEFTIPIDLCSLYATLQQEARSQLEFPASVNSYGTTQDANVLVAVRANKVTFKVDGVSSNASIISKSESKTLKLSVFDVDRTLMQKNESQEMVSNPSKRVHEQSVSHTLAKSSRISYDNESSFISQHSDHHSHGHDRPSSSPPRRKQHNSNTNNFQSKSHIDNSVNVKQEPEDPDLIEIEPDPEPDDLVPKKEVPFMQIDYSSDVPHTQTSQAALERVSFPPSSRSSPSFRQNVPHVPDYSEPGPSQVRHGDQSADDFLVYQDDNDYGDDNEADYSNDGFQESHTRRQYSSYSGTHSQTQYDIHSAVVRRRGLSQLGEESGGADFDVQDASSDNDPQHPPDGASIRAISGSSDFPDITLLQASDRPGGYCDICGKYFASISSINRHKKAAHENVKYNCVCGRAYKYSSDLVKHMRFCPVYRGMTENN